MWSHAPPPLDKHHSLQELHLQATMSSEIFLCSMVVHMTDVSPIPDLSSRCAGRYMMTVKYINATALKTDTAKHKHNVPQTAFSGVFVITPFILDFPIFLNKFTRLVYYVTNRKTFILTSVHFLIMYLDHFFVQCSLKWILKYRETREIPEQYYQKVIQVFFANNQLNETRDSC